MKTAATAKTKSKTTTKSTRKKTTKSTRTRASTRAEAGAAPPGQAAPPPPAGPPAPPGRGSDGGGDDRPSPPPLQTALSTEAARNLAEVTKTAPMMQGITPRWLLRSLPWIDVSGGVYRVNRRRSYAVGDGVVTFTWVGASARVIPHELSELALLRGLEDDELLEELADRFVQHEHAAGDVLVEEGRAADRVILLARGKVHRTRAGKYGDTLDLGVLAEGEHVGAAALLEPGARWDFTVTAATACTVLALRREAFAELLGERAPLRAHIDALERRLRRPQDRDGQAAIELAAGHHGEPAIPRTFVDYERSPREYELAVAQTILHVHSRVADLYNDPMDQVREQLRLTVEALRERQEYELINSREFGLLHVVDPRQRLQPRSGPPTPDDLDELLTRRRKTRLLLAHPRTIAAFGRQCSRRGIYPEIVLVDGKPAHAWRDVPLLPCHHIPITPAGTSSILALRLGEEDQGVVGLRPASLPDQIEPGVNVRFMGINERAVLRYLVSAYSSVAVLIPDALGVLDNVEILR